MKKEFRSIVSSFEVRSAGESASPVIMGYAARFNEDSEPIMGMFYERIAPGAFDSALKKSDPRALFNHNADYVLGRKSAGTLRLKVLADGLYYEVTPPDTQFARDLVESMKRGDIKESSFAFTVAEDEWLDPEQGRDLPTRVIKRVGVLYDVSPVSYPAYPTTTSQARSAQDVFAEYQRKHPEKQDWREQNKELERQLRRLEGKPEEDIDMPEQETRTMGEFFQQVRMGTVPRDSRAAAGQNYTVDEDGGYLVEPSFEAKLLKLIETESVLYPRVNRIAMSRGNTLVQNYVPADSRKDGQRNGTVQAYWIDEADQYTNSKLRFGQKLTTLSKLIGLCYATEEVLEDAPVLENEITRAFKDEFSFKIDDAILNGDGVGRSPKGILTSPALLTIPAESGQAAASVVAANILKMWNAMPSKNRANAVWLINQDVEPQLIMMYIAVGTSGGVPVYLPPTGLSGAQYGTIMGRPVLPMEQCAALGAKGDIVLVDPTQYNWIEKGSVRGETSIHVKFDTDQTAFRFTLRASGYSAWDSSITPYEGSTQRSPFITLAPRTAP